MKDKPTVFIIHGMWANAGHFDDIKNYLETQGYNCVVPTLRHHQADDECNCEGRLEETGVLDFTNDLADEIAKLDEQPIIIGHSMGGLLAQMLTERGLGKATVLVTPAAPFGVHTVSIPVIRIFLKMYLRWGFWRCRYRPSYKAIAYGLEGVPEDDMRDFYDVMVHESGKAICEIGLWPFYKRGATKVDETKIDVPMLVIGAEKDRLTPASMVKKIAGKYEKTADYKEFHGKGHGLLWEQGWEETVDYIMGWVEGLEK